MFLAGFISDHRTASQLISQREAARTAPNFAQPIILAYGTRASAQVSAIRPARGCTLIASNKKINVALKAKALDPPINIDVLTH